MIEILKNWAPAHGKRFRTSPDVIKTSDIYDFGNYVRRKAHEWKAAVIYLEYGPCGTVAIAKLCDGNCETLFTAHLLVNEPRVERGHILMPESLVL